MKIWKFLKKLFSNLLKQKWCFWQVLLSRQELYHMDHQDLQYHHHNTVSMHTYGCLGPIFLLPFGKRKLDECFCVSLISEMCRFCGFCQPDFSIFVLCYGSLDLLFGSRVFDLEDGWCGCILGMCIVCRMYRFCSDFITCIKMLMLRRHCICIVL